MFFRREKTQQLSFADRTEALRRSGFAVTPRSGGAVLVERAGFAVELKDNNGEAVAIGLPGIRMGDEIAALVDGGFQKFFRSPGGRKKPALASELAELHDFAEDLKEALGQESYYNESLGTVSTLYLYDRVKDRDRGVPKRAWE